MPKTPINRETLKTHLQYGKWIYLLIAFACFFVGDLLYTMTEYRAPNERRVDIELVGEGYETASMDEVTASLLETGQAADETLEVVDVVSVQYTENTSVNTYGTVKFSVIVAAREGDIYVLPKKLFRQLYEGDGVIPLEGYVASGVLSTDGLDLSAVTLDESSGESDDDGNYLPKETDVTHLYGLPMDDCAGLRDYGYDPTDSFAVIMSYSANPDTAAVVLEAFRDAMKGAAQ